MEHRRRSTERWTWRQGSGPSGGHGRPPPRQGGREPDPKPEASPRCCCCPARRRKGRVYLSGFCRGGRRLNTHVPLSQPLCGSWSPLYPFRGCASCLLRVGLILHLKFLEIITPPFVEVQSLVWSQISGSPLQKKAKHLCRPENRWGGQTRLWAAPVTPDSQNAGILPPTLCQPPGCRVRTGWLFLHTF